LPDALTDALELRRGEMDSGTGGRDGGGTGGKSAAEKKKF